jgi:VWFA-related protein
MTHGPVIAIALAAAGSVLLPGGQTPQFRAGVDLIQIDVSVLDEARRPVPGLTADDFLLFDEEQQVTIEAVTEVRVPPPDFSADWMRTVTSDVTTNDVEGRRLVVILFDDGRLAPANRPRAGAIARQVIDRLGPEDLAAVVFTANNRPAQDFTADRGLLLRAVEAVESPLTLSAGSPIFQLYSIDVLRRATEYLARVPARRKAVVYISVGHAFYVVPEGSKSASMPTPGARSTPDPWGIAGTIDAVLRAAQRANVAVYAVDPRGSAARNPRARGASGDIAVQFLDDLSGHTGGFALAGMDDYSAGVDRIFSETGHYYLLGFRSAADGKPGKFRRLRVEQASGADGSDSTRVLHASRRREADRQRGGGRAGGDARAGGSSTQNGDSAPIGADAVWRSHR